MGFSDKEAEYIDAVMNAYEEKSKYDDGESDIEYINSLNFAAPIKELAMMPKGTHKVSQDYKLKHWRVPKYISSASAAVTPASTGETPAKKQGGVIKAQAGARIVNVAESTDIASRKAAGLGSNDRKAMTGADWADLAALITDIAGVGISFVPGLSIASAITGAGGSFAGFGADVSRDGFQ